MPFFVSKCRLNKLKPTLEAFMNNMKHIYEVDAYMLMCVQWK